MPKLPTFGFFLSTFIFLVACGDDSQTETQTPAPVDESISFVEACNQHCDYAHDEPEGCPDDLSQSLNSCLQKCATEQTMGLSESCEAMGVAYYTCTWTLSFICTEGRTDPTPSNLSDCSDQSGNWNACLLAG
jgi:hypothetical protein